MASVYKGGMFTPDTVLAEMRTVNASINSLGGDIARSDVSEEFRAQWEIFLDEWIIFNEENRGWLARALNTTYAKVIEFKERLGNWRKAFKALGGRPTSPALPEEKSGKNWWTIGAIVGGGLILWGVLNRD